MPFVIGQHDLSGGGRRHIPLCLVDGSTDAGVLASGQVAGIIDDLPSCAELIESIVSEAVSHLQAASAMIG